MFKTAVIPSIILLVMYHYMDIKHVQTGDVQMNELISTTAFGGFWILIGYFVSSKGTRATPTRRK